MEIRELLIIDFSTIFNCSGVSVFPNKENSDGCKIQTRDIPGVLAIAIAAVPEMDSNSTSAKKLVETSFEEKLSPKRAQNNSNKIPNPKKQKEPKNSKKSIRSKKENRPKNSMRYDGKNHLPRFDSNEYATRCKNDDCDLKTNVFCTKCNVHLCFTRSRNCFESFHVLELEQQTNNESK